MSCTHDCAQGRQCTCTQVAPIGKSYASPLIQRDMAGEQVNSDEDDKADAITAVAVAVIVFLVCILAFIGAGALHTHFNH
jgi:hypothetical protein